MGFLLPLALGRTRTFFLLARGWEAVAEKQDPPRSWAILGASPELAQPSLFPRNPQI